MSLKQLLTLFLLAAGEKQIADALKHRVTDRRREQLAGYAGDLKAELIDKDFDAAAHTIALILEGVRR